MSGGIGDLKTTHNVSERLYWNLWAPVSGVRNSKDVMSPLSAMAWPGARR